MKHHLLKNKDLDERCIYCNSTIAHKNWKPVLWEFFDYITALCDNCKRENWIKIDGCGAEFQP